MQTPPSSPPPSPPDSPPAGPIPTKPAAGIRGLIAVTAGSGGAGASLIALNLSVYIAQLGRTVAIVDANPAGAALHRLLGCDATVTALPAVDSAEAGLQAVPTPVPGLLLLPQLYERGASAPLRPGRRLRWARRIREIDADYVVMDLGTGTAQPAVDLFLAADLGITVAAPEPASVEGVYRFGRALFQRRLRRALIGDQFKLRVLERVLAELPPLPSPVKVVRGLARHDVRVANLAAEELSRLSPRIVVNGTRLRADAELGGTMSENAARRLGVGFDYLGCVEYDDAVRTSILRNRPVLAESPTSKAARSLERISRRLLALANASTDTNAAETERATPISLQDSDPTLYEVLSMHRGASDEELRRAVKRQRAIYTPGSLPLTSLLRPEELEAASARIEEAHDTLLDPLKRRAYDLSVFPDEPEKEEVAEVAVDEALEAQRLLLREQLDREIQSDTEFTGDLLRRVREARGRALEDIANETKISKRYLQAIEEEQFDALPALVYTRGFVQQLARQLKLDATLVTRTYLARYKRWRQATDQ